MFRSIVAHTYKNDRINLGVIRTLTTLWIERFWIAFLCLQVSERR